MLASRSSPVSSRGTAAPGRPIRATRNLTGWPLPGCSLDDSPASAGIDEVLDVLDAADADVFPVVAEHALVPEPVEDRAHHRPARPHEVGQLLLREAEVLPEAVLAARGEPARQLAERLRQPRLDALKREALEPALHLALALRKKRDEFPGDVGVMGQQPPEFRDRRPPYGNGPLGLRRVLGFGGAAQRRTEEVPGPQHGRGQNRPARARPGDGDLALEHAEDRACGIPLPVDRAPVPNRHDPCRRTVAAQVRGWNSSQERASIEIVRIAHRPFTLDGQDLATRWHS